MDAVFKETIEQKSQGVHLLEHLAPCIPYLDKDGWATLLQSGGIYLDGKRVVENVVLQVGQQLVYTIENYQEDPVNVKWQLLWEGDDIIAIHKPANLPVSRTTRNVYNTLIQLVRRESPWPDAHLLHRLDLETSGVILLSKNKQGASLWQSQLKTLITQKIYHAVVYGKPEWYETSLQCDLNTRKESSIRCQMHVCKEGEKGKASHTRFKVLAQGEGYSLLECELLSGRKHQIRAHLGHLGHPIVGDKIYAHNGEFYLKRLQDAITEQDQARLQAPHHLLHAHQITIHPRTDVSQIILNQDYPEAFKNFCSRVGLELKDC